MPSAISDGSKIDGIRPGSDLSKGVEWEQYRQWKGERFADRDVTLTQMSSVDRANGSQAVVTLDLKINDQTRKYRVTVDRPNGDDAILEKNLPKLIVLLTHLQPEFKKAEIDREGEVFVDNRSQCLDVSAKDKSDPLVTRYGTLGQGEEKRTVGKAGQTYAGQLSKYVGKVTLPVSDEQPRLARTGGAEPSTGTQPPAAPTPSPPQPQTPGKPQAQAQEQQQAPDTQQAQEQRQAPDTQQAQEQLQAPGKQRTQAQEQLQAPGMQQTQAQEQRQETRGQQPTPLTQGQQQEKAQNQAQQQKTPGNLDSPNVAATPPSPQTSSTAQPAGPVVVVERTSEAVPQRDTLEEAKQTPRSGLAQHDTLTNAPPPAARAPKPPPPSPQQSTLSEASNNGDTTPPPPTATILVEATDLSPLAAEGSTRDQKLARLDELKTTLGED